MTETTPPQFDTLRQAFSAVYRCPPAEFEKRVFWKCLYPHAWLPAHWMWWFERRFFLPDLEGVRAMGAARCEGDLQRAVDDLENLCLVERGIRRGTLMIRLSSSRLINLLRPLLPLLKPVAVVVMTTNIEAPTSPAASRNTASRAQSTARERTAGGPLLLRKLKRLHSDVVTGRPLADALEDAGWREEELNGLLTGFGAEHPELVWLREYVSLQRELADLRAENRRLHHLLVTRPEGSIQ